MLLYHCADLLWASRFAVAARAAGVPAIALRDAASLDRALEQAERTDALALVDLDSTDALDVIRTLHRSRPAQCAGRVRIVAFGPHVDEAALQAARDAGADDAIPRGALVKRLDALLAQTASRHQQP